MANLLAFIFGSLLLWSVGLLASAERGCPPAEDIVPCTCDDTTSVRLECTRILQPLVLAQVFQNAARYTFQEVHIRSSSLLYLPNEMFENARINELYIDNSVFVGLFADRQNTTTLEKLQLTDTRIQRGLLTNDDLKNVTSLKTFIVNGSSGLRGLSPSFSKNLPSSLKQIILKRTTIKNIRPGAFSGFPNLDKLEISSSPLKTLTRDMFPESFNVRFLYFDNNNISYIPNDLFTDMPQLQFLTMRNNSISEIPEPAFGKRDNPIPYIRFEDNPLHCNCLLVWLVKNKPEVLGGTCQRPNNLKGKSLQDLRPADFNC